MSSLTKLLYVDRHRRHIAEKGGRKTPLIMHYPIPESFETACISLRTGEYHTVRVRSQHPTRSGFFALDLDQEEESFSRLISHIYEEASKKDLGNVSEVQEITSDLLDDVRAYFETYELAPINVFVDLVGFAVLATSGVLGFPVEVKDPSTLTAEDLQVWQEEHLHVGKLEGVPVFYNPEMGPFIVFSADPKEVGVMTRVGDFVSVMVHNAERSVVILRVGLTHDDSGPDHGSSAEEHTGPEGS